jgi:hypothetical protein
LLVGQPLQPRVEFVALLSGHHPLYGSEALKFTAVVRQDSKTSRPDCGRGVIHQPVGSEILPTVGKKFSRLRES